MRYRPKDYRTEEPAIFEQLVQVNPYMKRVHEFPEYLLPYPTPEKFQELWKLKNRSCSNSEKKANTHFEIGCGSGRYLSHWAKANPEDVFLGFELRFKRLFLAAKKLEQEKINNVLLLRERGEFIDDYLPKNSIDCLHINFPDPWSKKATKKHRILSEDFLMAMHPLFKNKGQLRFKTDHLEYFETVTEIFQPLKNYKITEYSKDLHSSPYNEFNILTEFEMLFKSKGDPPIGYLLAEVL